MKNVANIIASLLVAGMVAGTLILTDAPTWAWVMAMWLAYFINLPNRTT